jgi:DNA-binding CsgD family transcriptional regulator
LTTFDDKKSVLETVVQHLRSNYKMKFTEIAKLLNKDSRTIWTAWSRAQKKDGKTS